VELQLGEATGSLEQFLKKCPECARFLQMCSNIAWLDGALQRFERLTSDIAVDSPNDAELHDRRDLVLLCGDRAEDGRASLRQASVQRRAPAETAGALAAAIEVATFVGRADRCIENRDAGNAAIALNRTRIAACSVCDAGSRLMTRVGVLEVRMMRLNGTEGIIDVLNDMVTRTGNAPELVIERGELLLESGDYDAALFDFSTVEAQDPRNRRAVAGLERANEMKKRATHVDHYAVLGIPPAASHSDVTGAYRSRAREWHPDQFRDAAKKSEAETMMKRVNIAFDVLSNPHKRRAYDAGHDPDDPGMQEDMQFDGSDLDGFNPFDLLFGNGGEGQGVEFEFRF